MAKLQVKISQKVEDRMSQQQREFFLREQFKEIKKELRNKFLKSPLCDATRYVKHFENSLSLMYQVKAVEWNGGLFVATGRAYTKLHSIITSEDGITWTGRGRDFFSQNNDDLKKKIQLEKSCTWEEVPAILPAGGFSLHHRFTIHGSYENNSSQPRRSFALHVRTNKSKPIMA